VGNFCVFPLIAIQKTKGKTLQSVAIAGSDYSRKGQK
jgi:hypothetical protein